MKKPIIIALTLCFAIFSCGEKTENQEGQEKQNEAKQETASTPTTSSASISTTDMIDAYLSVKDALVADDRATAAATSQALVNAIQEFDADANLEDLKAQVLTEAEKLATGDIATQRESFQALSVGMKEILKVVGTDRTIYQQYCPMYKNNTGGMWLSASDDIKNPLFGSSMLTCGKVEETLAMN